MIFDFRMHDFYICPEPVDMRAGAERLAQIVAERMDLSPLDRALFLFTGRRRNIVKIIQWDGNGFWLFSKRLCRGTFAWPSSESEARLSVTEDDVRRLLSGQDVWRRIPSVGGTSIA